MRLDIDLPASLTAELMFQQTVELSFGDHVIASWPVDDREAEFMEQPGDYWSYEERQEHEREFVSKFVAEKLKAVFKAAGLDGVQ